MASLLDTRLAASFARLALAGIEREFPNKPEHVFNSAHDAHTPRELHPAFYGCYDWHSSVHTHWLLARLLHRFPDLAPAQAMRDVLERHFSAASLAQEFAYAEGDNRSAFERPYGWAWYFRLVEETSGDPAMREWTARLRPLADLFSSRLQAWLDRQRYPIRTGVHSNTAFALACAWDYSGICADAPLRQAVEAAAVRFFQADRDAPARWEPNGNDFLSPSLAEADLMRRIMNGAHFARWLESFLPGIATAQPAVLFEPVTATDPRDGQGVHLDGLNLSRAWCLRGIAQALEAGDPRRSILLASAAAHLEAGLAQVESGDFLGEHWLATFAVNALCA